MAPSAVAAKGKRLLSCWLPSVGLIFGAAPFLNLAAELEGSGVVGRFIGLWQRGSELRSCGPAAASGARRGAGARTFRVAFFQMAGATLDLTCMRSWTREEMKYEKKPQVGMRENARGEVWNTCRH